MKSLSWSLIAVFCGWVFCPGNTLAQTSTVAPPPSPVREFKHSPMQPRSGEAVTISARLAAPGSSLSLEYQVVDPGQYVALNDADYKSRWTALPMTPEPALRNPEAGAAYTAQIPATVQTNRRLVRYRLKATDAQGRAFSAPPASDAEPNLAYFVYDGVPAWKAAIQPGSRDARLGELIQFDTNIMTQVQSYFLIAKGREVESAMWRDQSYDKEYRYTGTLVADGRVYDHVRYRARGGVWRHAMGKNMWKIAFNKGHPLEAQDDYGQPYRAKWSKLNLRACIQQGDYGRRGEGGMYEAVGFRLFNLAGVDSPRTHWISWRVITQKDESPPSQYQGDFWGMYLAIENEDGRFLKEHGLPDGNLYKMMMGQDELQNLGANQVTNRSDLQTLVMAYRRNDKPDAWWRTNVDLPRYYSYRSILEGIHHYDLDSGKNYSFYRNPANGLWCVIPWDIDLTWGDHMYGGGNEPFLRTVLSRPAFALEYYNRLREIRDLLFNPGETGRLIDECAAIIGGPSGRPAFVDADRAKWDYHPVMGSRLSMGGKAGQGLFFQDSPTGDFAGMVAKMKSYVKHRAAFMDRILARDAAIPSTPVINYTGQPGYPPDALAFKTTAFAGPNPFAAVQWRLGEIEGAKMLNGRPAQPGKYEITPVWTSAELTSFQEQLAIPRGVAQPGHMYRVRARMKDSTGRWSHWSAPVQFVAGAGAKRE